MTAAWGKAGWNMKFPFQMKPQCFVCLFLEALAGPYTC